MEYSNDKIKKLIKERNRKVSEMDSEIQKEIEKEKAKYKFSWPRFLFMISAVIICVGAIQLNAKLFPKTSIWSWDHYSAGFIYSFLLLIALAIGLITTIFERKKTNG